jgi:hypothetical protein
MFDLLPQYVPFAVLPVEVAPYPLETADFGATNYPPPPPK